MIDLFTRYLVWHQLVLTRLYTAMILVFHKKIHFEVGHRWYFHKTLGALKKLCKFSLRISVTNCVWVFWLQIYLCLFSRYQYRYAVWNWAFHQVKHLGVYDGTLFKLEYCWNLLDGWMNLSIFFLENSTSRAGLLG